MSQSLVLVVGGRSARASAQHTLLPTPMAPPASGGPIGAWAHFPFSGLGFAVKNTCWRIKTVMHTFCRQQRRFLAVRYLDIISKPHEHVNTFTYTLSWAHTAGTP